METRAGDPGAFAHFDLHRVDSPAFVVDAAKLRANLAILADVRDRAGIKVLAALKAFSMWSVAPIIGEYLIALGVDDDTWLGQANPRPPP